MTNPHFLAIDLETTGLDPKRDRILEIGLAFVHRQTLEVVAEKSWIVPTPFTSIAGLLSPDVLEMHAASGLWRDLDAATKAADSSLSREQWISALLRQIETWARSQQWQTSGPDDFVPFNEEPAEPGPMLGSSAHFDREFLRHADGGAFASLLNLWTHRNLDVSAIKECAKTWAPDLEVPEPAEPKHRVLADIRNSVRLLDFYRRKFFRPFAEAADEAEPDAEPPIFAEVAQPGATYELVHPRLTEYRSSAKGARIEVRSVVNGDVYGRVWDPRTNRDIAASYVKGRVPAACWREIKAEPDALGAVVKATEDIARHVCLKALEPMMAGQPVAYTEEGVSAALGLCKAALREAGITGLEPVLTFDKFYHRLDLGFNAAE